MEHKFVQNVTVSQILSLQLHGRLLDHWEEKEIDKLIVLISMGILYLVNRETMVAREVTTDLTFDNKTEMLVKHLS